MKILEYIRKSLGLRALEREMEIVERDKKAKLIRMKQISCKHQLETTTNFFTKGGCWRICEVIQTCPLCGLVIRETYKDLIL